ncbi:MAG: asparagine synthetase A [Candidatus Methanofastidiosia archaeon]
MKQAKDLQILKKRYFTIRSEKMKRVLKIQHKLLWIVRKFLREEGFLELLPPIIGPVTDPGIRGAKQVSFDYYGSEYKIMSSMILYKQMAISSIDKIFSFSPNIRLEPKESVKTGRHLAEFCQVDVEKAHATYKEIMDLIERLLLYVFERIRDDGELRKLDRTLRIPKVPFERIIYKKALDILSGMGYDLSPGEEVPWDCEKALSLEFEEPFFIVDYPISARGFYDLEDPKRSGILRDFDLIYPQGFGEAISGGEREYRYERVVERMRKTGEDPSEYLWYLEMLKDGIPPSAGFGLGVERLTRFICGLTYIWESSPFPKVPGIVSP